MAIIQNCSVVIITGGARQKSLLGLIASLQSSANWKNEIIVVGNISDLNVNGVQLIDYKALAENGEISKLKNIGASKANHDLLCFMDDDLELPFGWSEKLEPLCKKILSGQLDIGGPRVVGPSGSRWYDWSWASRENPNAPTMLLPYETIHANAYISGCCQIMRRDVWMKVTFNQERGYYQKEDVDFCHRAYDLGYKLTCDPGVEVIHLLLPQGRNKQEVPAYVSILDAAIYEYRCGKNIAEAQDRLDEAYESGLPKGHYFYFSGLFSFLQKRRNQARKFFSESVQNISSENEPALAGQAHYRLGLTLLSLNEKKKAKVHWAEANRIVPDHPFACFRLDRI